MTKLDAIKPRVRVAVTPECTYVLEMTARWVQMRPKYSRAGDAVVLVSWHSIYERALMARAMRRR